MLSGILSLLGAALALAAFFALMWAVSHSADFVVKTAKAAKTRYGQHGLITIAVVLVLAAMVSLKALAVALLVMTFVFALEASRAKGVPATA